MVSGVALPVTAQASYTVFTARPEAEGTSLQPAQRRGANALVTLAVQDSTIKYVVNALARQAGLQPNYYNSVVLSRRIRLHVSNMRVMEAVAEALRGTGLEAKLLSDGVTLSVHPHQGAADADRAVAGGIITGHVIDSTSGAGVRGAQVRVEGVKLSAMTSDSGNFTLRGVPPGDQVLQVRLFGYRPVTRSVTVVDGERTTVRIAMVPVPTVLSGVVTTATGTQRRLEVGNDITTLNVDSIRQVAPITSVTDLLESRVPGLTVQHTSGIPGAPSRVRLRGVGSVSRNNDPIVIVNGIRVYAQQSDPRNTDTLGQHLQGGGKAAGETYAAPSPLDQIDPNSIETIEVLKGPSASAMYGSDAANGVIVITTKHGRPGPAHWSLSLDQGLSFQPGSYPIGLYRFGHYYDGPTQFCLLFDQACTLDSVVAFQALNNPDFSVTTGHGSTQQLNGTVSGGVGGLTYALTGSYAHYTGQLKLPDIEVERFIKFHSFAPPGWMRHPDQYTTQGGASQLDLPLGSAGGRQGTVSLTSSLFKSDQQQSSLQSAISVLEGTYVDTTQLGQDPILPEFYERATHGSLNFTNALSVSWPLASWLPLSVTGGVNIINTTQQTLTPRDYKLDADSVGYFAVDRGTSAQYTLNANSTIPSRWAQTAVGFNFDNTSTTDLASSVSGLPIGVTTPTSFTGLLTGVNSGVSTQSSTGASTYGWFVAPTLNLHSRFFVTPGLRLDGGSASGGRVSTSVGGQSIRGLSGFPKTDFSWLVIDPSGQGAGSGGWRRAVSLLRLRGAFGTAGRQPDPGDQLRLFTPVLVPAVGNQAQQDAVQLSALGNTQLRPERSREVEYGFETQLWDNRLSLNLTGSQRMTYDAIIDVPVAPSILEFASVKRNIGVIRNTDLELQASATVIDNAAVRWDIGGNFTHMANLVVRLNPGQAPINSTLYGSSGAQMQSIETRIVPGYPLNGDWARPILGYADNNGDGIIEPGEVLIGDSLRYVGQPQPNYEAAFNTDIALLHGRLTAHTTFAYQNGVTQINQVGAGQFSYGGTGQFANVAAGPLFGNDPSAPLSQQAAIVAFANYGLQTPYGLIQVVNTLRWQSLSLNYVAPVSLARLVHARQLAIALQGYNLGLHTNYRGKDPSVNALSSGETIKDSGQLPLPRTFDLKFTLGN